MYNKESGSSNQTQRLVPGSTETAEAAGALMMWDRAEMLCGPEGKAAHVWGDPIHLLRDSIAVQYGLSILSPASHSLALGAKGTVC